MSMRHMMAVLTATAIIALAGCTRAREQKPKGKMLPAEVMIEVLADAHVAEAALQNIHGPRRDSLATLYYSQIFAIHGIAKEDFEYTYDRMRQQPELLDKIYGEVMARLDRFRAGAYAEPAIPGK